MKKAHVPVKSSRTRRWMTTIGMAATVWAVAATQAWAGGVVGLQLLAQQDDGTVVVGGSHNYVLDVFIVVVLFGLALFSVCRSSRRV